MKRVNKLSFELEKSKKKFGKQFSIFFGTFFRDLSRGRHVGSLRPRPVSLWPEPSPPITALLLFCVRLLCLALVYVRLFSLLIFSIFLSLEPKMWNFFCRNWWIRNLRRMLWLWQWAHTCRKFAPLTRKGHLWWLVHKQMAFEQVFQYANVFHVQSSICTMCKFVLCSSGNFTMYKICAICKWRLYSYVWRKFLDVQMALKRFAHVQILAISKWHLHKFAR